MSAAPKIYDFAERMEFSRGQREQTDKEILLRVIHGAKAVHKTEQGEDRAGVDYVITMRNGAEVNVDGKTRTPGCSRFWKDGPELALEKWSVMPGGKYNTPVGQSKTGWTLSESSSADLILFTFDIADSERVYLMPFQLLRVAFRENIEEWFERYKVDIQSSSHRGLRWQSQAVFVPARVVMKAVAEVMEGVAA